MTKMTELLQKEDKKLDIVAYQKYIRELYVNINGKRDFADIYGYLHRNIGYIGKSIEVNTNDPAKLILTISWLFSLSTYLDINILEALIKKFPGICPYCLQSHCVCYHTNKKPLKPMSAFDVKTEIYYKWDEVRNSLTDFNLETARKFISDIYPYNEVVWKSAGYQSHILKLHQEMTEIHEAYSRFLSGKKPIEAVMDEIADVFAWLLSAWSILFPKESLDRAFVDYYFEDCTICKQTPCICGLSDSRSATLMDFDKISQLVNCIKQIMPIYPKYDFRFHNLLEIYESVNETQNMPIVVAALRDTKELLEIIWETAISIDVSGKSASCLSKSFTIVNDLLQIESRNGSKEKNFDVFLSYSSANKDLASEIYELLNNNKHCVFMAEKDIKPSTNWDDMVKSAMKNSRKLFVLMTPESIESDWVKSEAFTAEILDYPILPILLQVNEKQIPDRLKKYKCVNFHEKDLIVEAAK